MNKTKAEILGANHIKIRTDKGIYLQSYNSIIVFIAKNGKVTLGKDWDYSTTTGRYRNQFLNETKKETQFKIDNKTYIVDNNLQKQKKWRQKKNRERQEF